MAAFSERHNNLIADGNKLWGDRAQLDAFWFECFDNFYPQRNMFLGKTIEGQDITAHLATSYPLLAARELATTFASMLRPRGKRWLSLDRAFRQDDLDRDSRVWLNRASNIQWQAMYDPAAQFVRATAEADYDFVVAGQTVISHELAPDRSSLLYRCWHLKDCVWSEGRAGTIKEYHRKWQPTRAQLVETFGAKNVAPKINEDFQRNRNEIVNIRHVVIASDNFDSDLATRKRFPWVSLYLDLDNNFIVEERPQFNRVYTVPRWQTVSGTQYAFSPAVIAALPDARLIQQITFTLLQAGERAADPPMVGTEGAIRSDVDLRAGAVTWVDAEYDERLGEALRPLMQDKSGIPFGMGMQQAARQAILEAFYLNKIQLPPPGRDMTAYEIGQRVNEYVRQALPLFEPMEDEYNAQLAEQTFGLLMRAGAFGAPDDMPQALRGANVRFRFDSPLQAAEGQQKGALLQQAVALTTEAAQFDKDAPKIVDASAALRDALYGIGVPAKWTRSEQTVQAMADQEQRALAAQALAQNIAAIAQATGGADASRQINQAA